MRFLVFGGRGWIGSQLLAILAKEGHVAVVATSRANDRAAVEAELREVQPDRVISFIGRTRGEGFNTIDYLEQKGKLVENMRDNMWGPIVLATLCKTLGIHFTYLGTGCIFHYDDGDFKLEGGKGFSESDDPNFFSSQYSTVKGYTDRMFRLMFDDCALNCRIRMPITEDDSPYNFITKIANYAKVVNIPNSMTVLPDLLPLLVDMAVKKVTGTINLTNPGAISHNEVLQMYKEEVDPGYTWANFTVEEQDRILMAGRSNNTLDTSRLQTLYPSVRGIKDAVRAVCAEMKRRYPKGVVARRQTEGAAAC